MEYLDQSRRIRFPDPNTATPLGIVAQGGNLSPGVVLSAYEQGLFPWYEEDPILWFSPDPRFVLFLEEFHFGRRLARTIRNGGWGITFDHAFDEVIGACREPRRYSGGTWITAEMETGYRELHTLGRAHSVEVWRESRLAGGLYGLAVGGAFSGESMFSRERDASKIALVALAGILDHSGVPFLDCQSYTTHMAAFGAREIPRTLFLELLGPRIQAGDVFPACWRDLEGREMLQRGVELSNESRCRR
ncbi:MAG: leucyl/phenylalanyl-tRNA--protein transferase [Spirochaetaceae bacterium]|nr:MAG: leucyl/phenylalanyl-tRNA--protein transferase [Spirochaetaceae bacterium]